MRASAGTGAGERGRGLLEGALVVAAATALSRLLGLVREVVIADKFGASAEYDAFIVAFLIPHLLRRLLAEGALSTAFVPLFAAKLARGRAAAERFAGTVLTLALLLFPLIIWLGVRLAPSYVPLLADGFDEAKRQLTLRLVPVTFPFLGLVGLAAIVMGILSAHERFLAPAVAPALFNVGLIVGALALAPRLEPPILGLAYGVLLGGLAQLLFQIPFLKGVFRYRPALDVRDEGLGKLCMLMLPTVLGLVVVELNVLVDNKLASRLEDGSIAALQYAVRLFQLPLGLFAVALATVLLPRLSAHAAQNQRGAFRDALGRALGLALFILLPATAGLIALGGPIIALLFEHGRFTPDDTARTLAALRFLALGIVGYGLAHPLTRAFYALQDTRTPVWIGAVAVGLNIALDYALVGPLGVGGLALATAAAGLVQMGLLAVALQRRLRAPLLSPLVPIALKLALSAGAMGLLVWGVDAQLARLGLGEALRVGLGLTVGALSYGALVLRARLVPEELVAWLKAKGLKLARL